MKNIIKFGNYGSILTIIASIVGAIIGILTKDQKFSLLILFISGLLLSVGVTWLLNNININKKN